MCVFINLMKKIRINRRGDKWSFFSFWKSSNQKVIQRKYPPPQGSAYTKKIFKLLFFFFSAVFKSGFPKGKKMDGQGMIEVSKRKLSYWGNRYFLALITRIELFCAEKSYFLSWLFWILIWICFVCNDCILSVQFSHSNGDLFKREFNLEWNIEK